MSKNRVITVIMLLALLLASIMTFATGIESVEAEAIKTIYIRADGTIEPSNANITTSDRVKYTFNGTNHYPIVIERSNITIDGNGFAVQGKKDYGSVGINLYNLNNVTIANVTVRDFGHGIKLNETSNIKILGNTFNNMWNNLWGYDTYKTVISGNNMTGASNGLYFRFSFSDTISSNNITGNTFVGMQLTFAYDTVISGNSISKNFEPHMFGYSVLMYRSAGAQIYENNIMEGHTGIKLDQCNNTRVYQNNVTTHVWEGISIYGCINILMYNNLLKDNRFGLDVGGTELNHYLHSINTSNLVDGKPVYYLINQHNNAINASTHPKIGFLALINSTNVIVEGLSITKSMGLLLAYAKNVKAQNSNFTDNYYGICLDDSSNSTINGNRFQRNYYGVYLIDSLNSTVCGNVLEENENGGIELYCSPNCTISNNEINGGGGYFGINAYYSSGALISGNGINNVENGVSISDSSENIAYANSIKNSGYAFELSNVSRSLFHQNNLTNNDCGFYIYSSSNNNIIRRNNIANNTGDCIYLDDSSGNSVCANSLTNSYDGIYLTNASRNIVYGNNITNNEYGVYLSYYSEDNKIYHNNFINNTSHAETYNSLNTTWDDGYPSGGNYWSGYMGVDPDRDGIGNTAYTIDAENVDRSPLMGPINVFDAGTWDGASHEIDIVSNSTISKFKIDIQQKIVSFNVTGVRGAVGFCRITIPNIIAQELWRNNYTVLLNGEPFPFKNWTDAAKTYIYINFTHSEHEIAIVPEFPLGLILSIFMIITVIASASACKRKHPSIRGQNLNS
jgi:parallel beta-helix repeat protein